jgi:hypothetical protein
MIIFHSTLSAYRTCPIYRTCSIYRTCPTGRTLFPISSIRNNNLAAAPAAQSLRKKIDLPAGWTNRPLPLVTDHTLRLSLIP